MATFCYTVLASDPSGSVQIGNILPFLFLNSSILSSSIKNKDFASPELMTNMLRTVSKKMNCRMKYTKSNQHTNTAYTYWSVFHFQHEQFGRAQDF